MLALTVLHGEGVKITGVYIERDGRMIPAEVMIVRHEDRRLHFYAPSKVRFDRLGVVSEETKLLANLANMEVKGHG